MFPTLKHKEKILHIGQTKNGFSRHVPLRNTRVNICNFRMPYHAKVVTKKYCLNRPGRLPAHNLASINYVLS